MRRNPYVPPPEPPTTDELIRMAEVVERFKACPPDRWLRFASPVHQARTMHVRAGSILVLVDGDPEVASLRIDGLQLGVPWPDLDSALSEAGG